MTGEVLPFARSEHQHTLEALPWYLTGTLDAQEQAQVEQHLAACAQCRSELQWQQVLREAVAAEEDPASADAGLERLRRALHAPGAAPAAAGARGAAWPGAAWLRLPGWAAYALCAQLCAVVALGWALWRSEPAPAPYHALSAAAAPAAGGNLIVVFDPQLPLHSLQQTLLASGARVVDGPLASGGFVLQAPPAQLAATASWLRGQPGVRLAERLDAAAAR
jgi:anti-sigma-K factor RskA